MAVWPQPEPHRDGHRAERSDAATRDGGQHLLMVSVDPSAAAFEEVLPGVAGNVGHLRGGAVQALRKASPSVPSRSMSSGLELTKGDYLEGEEFLQTAKG
jgi:hypothetical protein